MRFGVHIRMDHGLIGALDCARDLGCEAVQLFSGNPTGWARKPLDPDIAAQFASKAAGLDIHPIIIHTPYLVNLAAPDDVIWTKSRDVLADACCRAPMLGGDRVVTHIGSHKGAGIEAGIERIAEAVAFALEAEPRTAIALELGTGAGNSIGSRFEELARIIDRIGAPSNRLGIAIDTAHLYGAGYDLSTPEGVGDMFDQLNRFVGFDRLLLVHLNDTLMPLGSHRDRHYHIGEGNIGLDGFRAIVNHPSVSDIPGIIETPADDPTWDNRNLSTLRQLSGMHERIPPPFRRGLGGGPGRITSRPSDGTPETVSAALTHASARLASAGIDSPLLDAQLLLARALDCTRLDLIAHPERISTKTESHAFSEMLERRAQREPLAYITGRIEFFGLDIDVMPGVLVPRPDTEILVEQTLARLRHPAPKTADIGVGTGAIAIALATSVPDATVYATDLSPIALKVARANVKKHHLLQRVMVLKGDLLEPLYILSSSKGLDVRFDAIVSNPPYIPSGEISSLQPEVARYEPVQALDGGPDGLDAYRRLLPEARSLLSECGFIAVEVGAGQANDVHEIAEASGYSTIEVVKDLAGIERVVIASL